ncbi:MAG: tetratricopeptide repeat protein, partial [Xanthobacteraceae bacterium]
VAACTRLLQSAPADVNALGNRGVAYRLLGRYDEALADLDKALRINPDSAGLYLERGLVRDAAGDHDHAVADFSAAIARNATLVQAWFGRAMAYDAAGHHDLAEKDLAAAVQRNRTMVAALYMERGYALHERRQFAGARAAFDQAIALGPGWLSAYCGRAASYEETGDADRAVADYKKCLALKATTALEIERQQAARERLARLERR